MTSQTTAGQGPTARRLKHLKNSGSRQTLGPLDSQTVSRVNLAYIQTPDTSRINTARCSLSSFSLINNNSTHSNNVYLNNFAKITRRRFELMKKTCLYNDIMVGLALGGLVLAIIVQQLITSQVFEPEYYWPSINAANANDTINNPVLFTMRCVITLSTIALAVLNITLQVCSFHLQTLSTSRRPALVLIRTKHMLLTAIELVLCAIHPIPYDIEIEQRSILSSDPFFGEVPINVNFFPTLFMFVRFYLVARCVFLHHRLYRTRLTHMFGRVDHVSVGYRFIFRCVMDDHAGLIMVAVIAALWLGGAWGMQSCDANSNTSTSQFLNSLWVVIITFFTVS